MEDKQTKQNGALSLTAEQLQEILKTTVATAIAESKKEYLTDRQTKDIQDAQDARRQQAELVKQMSAERKHYQKMCSHMRRDGSSRAVYIQNGNYMLCQDSHCQKIIRPELEPELFNKLFQLNDQALFA